MKLKAVLTTLSGVFPINGFQEVDQSIFKLWADEVNRQAARQESAAFTIAANVVNFDQHADASFVDEMLLNDVGTGNVTSCTNLDKAGRFFRMKNTGAGAKTITHGNNIKIFNATATVVLLTGEYVKCYNDGTNVYVESVHHFAAQS